MHPVRIQARTVTTWALKVAPYSSMDIQTLSIGQAKLLRCHHLQRKEARTGPGKLLSVEEVHEVAGLAKCSPTPYPKLHCLIKRNILTNWRCEYNTVALLRCHHLHWGRGHCVVFECPSVHRRCRFSPSALRSAHDAQMHHEPEVPLYG